MRIYKNLNADPFECCPLDPPLTSALAAAESSMQAPAQLRAGLPKQALRVFVPQSLLGNHAILLTCLDSQRG